MKKYEGKRDLGDTETCTGKRKKLKGLFEKYGMGISENEFIEIFQVEYPKDWFRIQEIYKQQEEKRKLGKAAPMPEPFQYLRNYVQYI